MGHGQLGGVGNSNLLGPLQAKMKHHNRHTERSNSILAEQMQASFTLEQ